jgi:hypothetical protein
MKFTALALTILASAISTMGLLGNATAGVITGTGATPSKTQLGATDAAAFQISPTHTGHIVVVPYFTTQNGQMSVLHLVNTDRYNGKIVKLRFRGAHNGDSLLSLHIFLAGSDVWTGAVSTGPDGRAQIVTGDKTCTRPQLPKEGGQPFLTNRLNPALSAEQLANQTREGYIEAIVMADMPTANVYGSTSKERSALAQANRPWLLDTATCASAVFDTVALTDTDNESTAASLGLATPTSGLAATWYIMDVPGATTFSGAGTAIVAVDSYGRPGRGNFLVFAPTAAAVAEPERYTSDPLLVSQGLAFRQKLRDGTTSQPTSAAVIEAQSSDLPDLSTPYYLPASAHNARLTAAELSQQFSTRSVSNQYARDTSIAAQTDWVLSMPTKRYSVAQDYAQTDLTLTRVFSVLPPVAQESPQGFHSTNTHLLRRQDQGPAICSTVVHRFHDRESHTTIAGPTLIAPPPSPVLCGSSAVLSIGTGPSALSASVTHTNWTMSYENGWATLYFNDPLPVLGSAFLKLTNPNATPGIAGRYGLLYPHMTERP